MHDEGSSKRKQIEIEKVTQCLSTELNPMVLMASLEKRPK